MRKNRFKLYDNLGYFRSYKSRRRALQAINSLPILGNDIYKLVDSWDNSISFIKKM